MGSTFKELIAQFGNGRRDNIIFTLGVSAGMMLHFKDPGTDNASDRYYNLKQFAKKVQIIVNKVATITHINGQELKSPITLGTDSPNVWKSGIEWKTINVVADLAATTFEVYAS